MTVQRWFAAILMAWAAVIILAVTYGCATVPPEKVDELSATFQRNMKLCDPHGGMKRIDFESEYAVVTCKNDGKAFRIWYFKK